MNTIMTMTADLDMNSNRTEECFYFKFLLSN